MRRAQLKVMLAGRSPWRATTGACGVAYSRYIGHQLRRHAAYQIVEIRALGASALQCCSYAHLSAAKPCTRPKLYVSSSNFAPCADRIPARQCRQRLRQLLRIWPAAASVLELHRGHLDCWLLPEAAREPKTYGATSPSAPGADHSSGRQSHQRVWQLLRMWPAVASISEPF